MNQYIIMNYYSLQISLLNFTLVSGLTEQLQSMTPNFEMICFWKMENCNTN